MMKKRYVQWVLCTLMVLASLLPTALAADVINVDFYMDLQSYYDVESRERKQPIGAVAIEDILYFQTNKTLECWTPGMEMPQELLSITGEEEKFEKAGDVAVEVAYDVTEPEIADVGKNDAEKAGATTMEGMQTDALSGVKAAMGYQSGLFSHDGELIMLDWKTGQIWKLLDENGVFSPQAGIQLEWESFVYTEGEYSYTPDISCSTVMEGTLYLTAFDYREGGNNPNLYQWSLSTGKVGPVYKETFANSIAPYRDGLLLCTVRDNDHSWDESTQRQVPVKLGTMNPATGEIVELFELGEEDYRGLSFDAASNTAYYFSSTTLMSIPNLTLPAKPAAYFSTSTWGGGGYGLLGNALFYVADYQGVSVRTVNAPGIEDGALTIYGNYGNRAHMLFSAAHPEIPTALSASYYENLEQFTGAMVSGEKVVDVLRVSSDYAPFTRLVDKGYAMDLSESAELMEIVNQIYPALRDFCMKDGKLYALPVDAYGQVFCYSPETWEELGLSQEDVPTSFYGFLDFMDNWADDYAEDFPDIRLFDEPQIRNGLLHQMISMYISYCRKEGLPLDFENELFGKLMMKFDSVDFSAFEIDMTDATGDDYMEFYDGTQKHVFLQSGNPMGFYSWQEEAFMPLSLDEGMEPIISVQMDVMFVNPRTPRVAQALEYLKINAQNYEASGANLAFFPQHNEPVEDPYFEENRQGNMKELEKSKISLESIEPEGKASLEEYIKYLEDWLANADAARYLASPERIASYRQNIAPYLFVTGQTPLTTWDDQGNNDLYNQINQYIDGAISAERFMKEVSKRTRMMELEDQ